MFLLIFFNYSGQPPQSASNAKTPSCKGRKAIKKTGISFASLHLCIFASLHLCAFAPLRLCVGNLDPDLSSYHIFAKTTSDTGYATQGRMQPAAFSSGLRPGQSMRYTTRPLDSWQMQARQVPLRHELTAAKPARSAASNSGRATESEQPRLCWPESTDWRSA